MKSNQDKRKAEIIEEMSKRGYENISGPASLNDHVIVLFSMPYEHVRNMRLLTNNAVRFYNEECTAMDSLLFREKGASSEKQADSTKNENDASQPLVE